VANLRFIQPYLPIREMNPRFEHFPLYPFYYLYQGNQVISLPENSHANGKSGQLERKHIRVSEIVHIGKEANNIEDEPLETGKVQVFRNEEKERLRIVDMRQCDAERWGINRGMRWRIKKKESMIIIVHKP
jgi:hypothetical protein